MSPAGIANTRADGTAKNASTWKAVGGLVTQLRLTLLDQLRPAVSSHRGEHVCMFTTWMIRTAVRLAQLSSRHA
jgi:hypothetical protein